MDEFTNLRQRLPGYSKQDIICSDSTKQKKLIFIHDIRGFMDELIDVTCYWVTYADALGERTDCFTDLNAAVTKYASI